VKGEKDGLRAGKKGAINIHHNRSVGRRRGRRHLNKNHGGGKKKREVGKRTSTKEKKPEGEIEQHQGRREFAVTGRPWSNANFILSTSSNKMS